MAKLQVLIAMTLDGSIPAEDDPLLQWMRDDKDGFSYGRDKCTRRLYPGYPLVDFMCEKDMSDPSILYQAEIHDEESIELLRGLSVYHLIDEMIISCFLPLVRTINPSQNICTWRVENRKIQNIQKRNLSPGLLQDIAIRHCNILHLQYFHQSHFYGADFLFPYYSMTCHTFMWRYVPLVYVLAYIIMKPVAQHGVKNGIITLKTEFIMIQIDRETFQMMLHQIMERFDRIDDRLNRMNRQTAALEGDKLLDNQDMCELLGVTKRTLARYRQKKLVTYYMIDGRTYYKASEVQDFLSRKGKVLPAKIKKELGIQF